MFRVLTAAAFALPTFALPLVALGTPVSAASISAASISKRAIGAPSRDLTGHLSVESTAIHLNQSEGSSEDEISQLLDVAYDQEAADDFETAAATYRQVLTQIEAQALISPETQGEALRGLGSSYVGLQAFDKALPELEAALSIFEALSVENDPSYDPDRPAESDYANILLYLNGTLGLVHDSLGNFATALGYYQRAVIDSDLSASSEEQLYQLTRQVYQLHNIGGIETRLGQYTEAEETLKQALALSTQIEDLDLKGSVVFSLGWLLDLQKEYDQAISNYQVAVELFHRDNNNLREIRALNNLGVAYLKQQNPTAAKEAFDKGFDLLAMQDDPIERAYLLDSLGSLFQDSEDFEQAWAQYFQALRLSQTTDDKPIQIDVLLNLGGLMESQDQPDLAIFFYKQAIAKIETIRQDLQKLSDEMQQRYALTIEDYYRRTADLLLQQGREAEAVQILELLKLQEIKAYLRDGQSEESTGAERFNTPSEDDLLRVLNELPAETSLAEFMAHSAARALSDPSETGENIPFDLEAVNGLQSVLNDQPVKTAVLYPLILDDRLEILLITPDGVVESFSTDVSKTDISNTVGELQKKLKSKPIDSKPPAQTLYDWLIRPIDETLALHEVENIIYLPDGVLRYVPLAALHNGEQWLAAKYQSHNITATTVDDLAERNSSGLSVVAGAFTDNKITHEVQIGSQSFPFSGLNGAQQEVDNLQEAVPDSMALFNNEFTSEAILEAVGDHRIVHLATHAKFVSGQPEESFVLFGDGGTVNMRDIQSWTLPTVDLVVLSACETGSSFEGEGKEILGLGYQIHQTGAASAIASLWAVDDTSTAALMTQFYRALSNGQSKAQALQTAQTAMINSDSYNNPHAWAAFILIGNGR
ncbi:MAG: CHAT domain-containing protein [Cyanobacteria bacterium P01_F01_bin.53]